MSLYQRLNLFATVVRHKVTLNLLKAGITPQKIMQMHYRDNNHNT